ncbi:MAG: PIN domain-containing protein [Thermoanaerobaculia bacterium]
MPNTRTGVLDAGVLLARLDPERRSHAEIVALLNASAEGRILLWISVVNLAEVLEHSRDYRRSTGVDPVALLDAFRVSLHAPDLATARRVAELSAIEDASLADRFAAATADVLGARLYTTDRTLEKALRRRRRSVTCF